MFVEQMLITARERLVQVESHALVKTVARIMAQPHTDLVVVCDGNILTAW